MPDPEQGQQPEWEPSFEEVPRPEDPASAAEPEPAAAEPMSAVGFLDRFATRLGATGEGFFAIRRPVPGWQRWFLGTLPILALLGVWWLLTGDGPAEGRVISPTILPSPLEVLRSFPALWFERALTRNVIVSFSRVLAGFAVGVALAFPLGLAMGSFSRVKATFNPLAVLGAYLPIPALVPLTLSLFGTGEKQKVAFLGLAFVIYLLPLIGAAVEQVDTVYLKTAYTLGASRWQAVSKVLLPVAWPEIFQSLRLGFGIGWSYILLAEMVDIGKGLGGIIIVSQRRGPREHIYLVLLVIVALAFLTDKAWATLGKALFPNREAQR
jgi:NitT/TauT family transport system permease protein